jgi:TPR repeat protein
MEAEVSGRDLRQRTRFLIACGFLALAVFSNAAAGPLEDGQAASSKGDFRLAAVMYRQAADQGNAIAQLELGTYYFAGVVVAQDYAQAAKWWRMAADQGNANAQGSLARVSLQHWARCAEGL